MQNKTAKDIQNELSLIRLAYREREARLENLNRYLAEPCPMAVVTPYLISAALVIGLAGFLVSLFL